MLEDPFVASSRRSAPSIVFAVLLLATLAIAYSVRATSIGWNAGIYGFHGFRQAQTAITAESIRDGGPILRYETPVLGPPWSVPFEFPLYQVLVALLARTTGFGLDQTGRFVSEVFRYASFFPLAAILSGLGLRGIRCVPTLALFAASPSYIFLSRLFMIESTALFFSLMYVDQLMRLLRAPVRDRRRPWYIALATLFGVLAGLVKVTTLAPFLLLGVGLALWSFYREYRRGGLETSFALSVGAFCLGLPVVATAIWTRFADGVKAQNPLGIHLTSRELRLWNFGTLAQRVHWANYGPLANRLSLMVGSLMLGVLVALVALLFCRRSVWPALFSLTLYVVTIEIFFNLYFVHEYYAYANGIFGVAAVGMLLGSIIGLPGRRAWVGVALLATVLVGCVRTYERKYHALQRDNARGRPQTAALIDRTTGPTDVILITGLDWSSELPYQSHRRALMAPAIPLFSQGLQQAIHNQGADRIAAMVVCGSGRSEGRLPSLLQELGMADTTSRHAEDCDVYERQGS